MNKIIEKLKDIRMVAFDLRGTLLTSCKPEEVKDLLVHLREFTHKFKEAGLLTALITASDRHSVIELVSETGFDEVIHSCMNKVDPAENILQKYGLDFENLFYFADDILDVPLLSKAGIAAVPHISTRHVKRYADIIIREDDARKRLHTVYDLFHKNRPVEDGTVV